MAEKLSAETAEILRQFGESMKAITRSVDFMDVEETSAVLPTVDPETGEIIETLRGGGDV